MDDRQKDWIRKRATTFLSGDPEGPLTDGEQAAVDRVVDHAQVVALGEGVHGSKTVMQSMERVLRFLIQERQADIIVLEACLGATQTLNRYVVAGQGAAQEAVIATGSWNYASQEFLGFVQWLRNDNRTASNARRPVRVVGCDCQSLDGPKTELLRLLQEFVCVGAVPQEDAAKTAALLMALPTDRDLSHFVELVLREMDVKEPAARRIADIEAWQSEFIATVPASLAKVTRRLQDVRQLLPPTVSDEDRFVFERCGRLLEQVVDFYSPGDAIAKRDTFMAENVLAVRRHFQPRRMILFSHHLHVARVPIFIRGYQFVPMGRHLAQELGHDYRAIGSAFYDGEYLALAEYRPEDDLVEEAHPPGALALELMLQEVAADWQSGGLLVDFSQSRCQECESPWPSGIEMRIGEAGRQGSYEDCFIIQQPVRQYDGMMFLEKTSPITVLPGYYRYAIERWRSNPLAHRPLQDA